MWSFDTPSGPWIGGHGAENILRHEGKSLKLDYVGATGPSRLGVYIGSGSHDTGYGNEIHIFYFAKMPKEFFPYWDAERTNYKNFAYLKMADIVTGFSSVQYWDGGEARNHIDTNLNDNILYNYGLNYSILGMQAVTGSPKNHLSGIYSTRYPDETSAIDEICILKPNNGTHPTPTITDSNQYNEYVQNNRWFAVEYRIKKSDPPGSDTGEFEQWIYDENGNTTYHYNAPGHLNFGNGAPPLCPDCNYDFSDHAWNMVMIGGNRYPDHFTYEYGYVTASTYYVDEVIINGTRIGPTYFNLARAKNQGSPKYMLNRPPS